MKHILFLTMLMLVPHSLFCPNGGHPIMYYNEYEKYKKQADEKEQEFKQVINTAEKLQKEGKLQDALTQYAQIAEDTFDEPGFPWEFYELFGPPPSYEDMGSPQDPYENARALQTKALQKINDIAIQLKTENKYNDALAAYKQLPDIFSKEIRDLEKTIPLLPQLMKAKNLIQQKKYDEAHNLLVPLKQQQIEEALKLDAQIKRLQRAEGPQEAPKEWIFLRKIDLPDKEATDWRIKDKRLELKTDAKDPITQFEFVELLQDAKDQGKPYILLGLRKDDFYYFNDGSLLSQLGTKWEDPATRVKPDFVEVYVMGNDDKLTYLGNMREEDIFNTFFWGNELNPDFEAPVGPRVLIADAFKAQASKLNPADIRAKILLQHAREWYAWALEYLEPGSEPYIKVENNLKQIPYEPELLGKKEPQVPSAPGALMESLHNLTVTLRRLSNKLS